MRNKIDPSTDNRNMFAQRLQLALKHDGITYREFAKMACIAQATVAAYVSGVAYPSFDALMRIQKALDISLDWLCGLVD